MSPTELAIGGLVVAGLIQWEMARLSGLSLRLDPTL